jgi:hypothetical protein
MKKKSHDIYPLKKHFDGIFNPTTFSAPLMGFKNPTAPRSATWDKKSHDQLSSSQFSLAQLSSAQFSSAQLGSNQLRSIQSAQLNLG